MQDTGIESYRFAISSSHIFYINHEKNLCYKNILTQKDTFSELKCSDITTFADFVAVIYFDNELRKTKLFKATTNKIEYIA